MMEPLSKKNIKTKSFNLTICFLSCYKCYMVWTGRFDMNYLIVGMSKPIFGIVQHNDTYIDFEYAVVSMFILL